jgi:hypothetical protein
MDLVKTVLRIQIQIRIIHMFLGLSDPDSDALVRDTDPDPDYQVKIVRKHLSLLVWYFFMTFYRRKMMEMYLQKVIS